MASLQITRNGRGDDWAVWIGSDVGNYRFVIGHGATRDAAVAQAVEELEHAVEELQAPIGVVQEHER